MPGRRPVQQLGPARKLTRATLSRNPWLVRIIRDRIAEIRSIRKEKAGPGPLFEAVPPPPPRKPGGKR